MKEVKRNMFHYSVISLEVIVLIVLFLSVPVSAQYGGYSTQSNPIGVYSAMQSNPMMQTCFTQTNPVGVYSAMQTNPFGFPGPRLVPGSSSTNIQSIPEPLEYLDSSWKDASYWYRLNMESYGWKRGISPNYVIPNVWDTGSFSNTLYTPSLPTNILDTGSFTHIWNPIGSGGGSSHTFSTCSTCFFCDRPKLKLGGMTMATCWAMGCGGGTMLTCGDMACGGGTYGGEYQSRFPSPPLAY